jgi:NADPH:quinone reductase-like Zn-dependent oxidoreductase
VFTLLPLLTGSGREHHGEILAEGARLVDAGRLRVRVDPRRFTLADAEDAHRVVASGTGLGKVVVEISNAR